VVIGETHLLRDAGLVTIVVVVTVARVQPRLRVTKSETHTRISASVSEGQFRCLVFIGNVSKWRLFIGLPFIPYWSGVRSGKRVMKPLRFGICTFGSVWALIVASASISLFWAKI
jgi:hypothetical protein